MTTLELIDIKAIAQALGVKQTYVRDRLVKRPDFPRPHIATSQRFKRWTRESLDRWIAAQAKKQAR